MWRDNRKEEKEGRGRREEKIGKAGGRRRKEKRIREVEREENRVGKGRWWIIEEKRS